jgi:hypothetical protein
MFPNPCKHPKHQRAQYVDDYAEITYCRRCNTILAVESDEPESQPALFDDTAALPLFSGTAYRGDLQRFSPQPAPPKQLGLALD